MGLRCSGTMPSKLTVKRHAVGTAGTEALPVTETNMMPLAFAYLSAAQLVDLIPPKIAQAVMVGKLRNHFTISDDRLAVLDNQGSVWGDDEVLFHMEQCVSLSGNEHLVAVDPLASSSWISSCSPQLIREVLAATGKPDITMIVTAFLHNGHWTPCMWHSQGGTLLVYICEQDDVDIQVFQHVHAAVCGALGASTFSLYCERRSARASCGAAACAYLEARINNTMTMHSDAAVIRFHAIARANFRSFVERSEKVIRPWGWGAGVTSTVTMLQSLLQLHGVPPGAAVSRSKLIMQSLGSDELSKAMNGPEP